MNDNEKLVLDTITDYDTLVLSGASTKGIVTLGAIQYAYDNYLLKKVYNYIGTSVGSIICFLLTIGFTPVEIIVYICSHQIMEKIQHFDIVSMVNGNGASSFLPIQEQLEKMAIEKIGFLPTFNDIKNKFNKNLICVTYNLSQDKAEYLSYDTYPNLPCITAIKMSSNLPFVFENFKYGEDFYIDGGISDNFPIDLGDQIGSKVLGIVIVSDGEFNSVTSASLLEKIYKLMFIPVSQSIQYKISKASNNCTIIKLECCSNIKVFNFNINSKTKLELFSSGYQQFKKINDNII